MYAKGLSNYIKKIIPAITGSLIGAYVALFWVADGKYNIAISRLESRVTNIVTRLESENWKKAIELVPNLQNRKIPLKPVFIYPNDVVKSLNSSYDEVDLEVIEELQSILVSKKEELNNLNLANIILTSLDLTKSNFSNSNLHLANLSYAILNNSNLSKTNLVGVDFSNASYIDKANFNEAKYNSRPIKMEEIPLYKEVMMRVCNEIASEVKNNDPFFEDDCHREVLKDFEITYGPPTKFPEGFDPKAHGMIDVSEIIDQMKNR